MPLKIKESFISLIMESIEDSGLGIVICDEKSIVHYINNSTFNIISGKISIKNPEDIIGKNLCEVIPAYENLFEKLAKNDQVKKYEILLDYNNDNLEKEDAVITWIINDAYLYTVKSEKYIVIVLHDQSLLKKVQLDLLKYERKLNSIIESIPDIVYRVNPDGEITFISDSIAEYGYTPEELVGTNILDIVHPDDKEKAFYVLKERRTGERKTLAFEVRLLTKKGNVQFEFEEQVVTDSKFFLVSSEGIYVPKYEKGKSFIGTQGVARDVTSKRYLELIQKKTDIRWKKILDTINDGYYESDINGKFLCVNKALADMLGYSVDEIIGKGYSDFVEPGSDMPLLNLDVNNLKSTDGAKLVDWIILRKDGKKRYVEASINRIVDSEGLITGMRGIIRDITEKHKLEKEILRFRKLEAIGILAGGIAHDYNNALTAILGNLSLAKMEVDPADASLMEILNDAEAASMKIMDLTKRLSDFSQGGRPERKVVSIANVINDAADIALHNFAGTVEFDISNELWKVDIDSDQIGHVIELVIQNAIEAMNHKGSLIISADNVTVDEEATRYEMSLQADDYVVVKIIDNGAGIEDDVIDQIFDPYFTTKDFASGMGLAISFAIIKRHHGYIDVDSVVNKGTAISIYIPSACVD